MTPFRDRLDFRTGEGTILGGPRRYLMLRPEALMGIFARLEGPARDAALEAFAASILEQGGDSARAYRASGGAGSDLARVVAETAPDLGWGVWTVRQFPSRLVVEVANSPFAAGFGHSPAPVCHAIRGMVRAVAGLVLGGSVTALESACAACGAPACRFEARAQEG